MQQELIELVAKARGIGEIAEADGAAAGLVLVSGANAAAGRADLAVTARLLARAVDLHMGGQDQRRAFGDLEIVRRNRDTLGADRFDLLDERPGIDDDAIADDRELVGPYHARGQEAEAVLDIADDQGMAGIVTTLKAHHDIGALREPIDDLAFSLVTPLGADHRHIRHLRILSLSAPRAPPHPNPLRPLGGEGGTRKAGG